MLAFCRSSWGVPRMLVRQWGILARLLVCHTATPSHMCAPREGSSRRLVAGGTAVGSRSKPLSVACACCHQHCAAVLSGQSIVISNHFLPRVVAQFVVLVWILENIWRICGVIHWLSMKTMFCCTSNQSLRFLLHYLVCVLMCCECKCLVYGYGTFVYGSVSRNISRALWARY